MSRIVIKHNGKIPLISESYNKIGEWSNGGATASPDLWYDASTGNFQINRAKSGANLNLVVGTFSYTSYNSKTILKSSDAVGAFFETTDNVGSYKTTTFIVGTGSLNNMFYSYGTTGSSTNRGQFGIFGVAGNKANSISVWSEDPDSWVYQPQKITTFDVNTPYIYVALSDHDSAYPGLSNRVIYNEQEQLDPSPISSPPWVGTNMHPTTATSFFKFTTSGRNSTFEVIHYYRQLTDAEIDEVQRYLSLKWFN